MRRTLLEDFSGEGAETGELVAMVVSIGPGGEMSKGLRGLLRIYTWVGVRGQPHGEVRKN